MSDFPWKGLTDRIPHLTEGMTTEKWKQIKPTWVAIGDLWLTQPGVYFHGIEANAFKFNERDAHPHVVRYGGEMYLEDGHHRLMWALLQRQSVLYVRVLDIPHR